MMQLQPNTLVPPLPSIYLNEDYYRATERSEISYQGLEQNCGQKGGKRIVILAPLTKFVFLIPSRLGSSKHLLYNLKSLLGLERQNEHRRLTKKKK